LYAVKTGSKRRLMKPGTLATSVILMCLFTIWANSQNLSAAKCVPVTAKNPQEALMMEASSNKNGCWVREKNLDGSDHLVFVSGTTPDKNYKPMITNPPAQSRLSAPPAEKCTGVLGGNIPSQPGAYATSRDPIEGTWRILTESGCDDIFALASTGSTFTVSRNGRNTFAMRGPWGSENITNTAPGCYASTTPTNLAGLDKVSDLVADYRLRGDMLEIHEAYAWLNPINQALGPSPVGPFAGRQNPDGSIVCKVTVSARRDK
jgi:hypothetical protein